MLYHFLHQRQMYPRGVAKFFRHTTAWRDKCLDLSETLVAVSDGFRGGPTVLYTLPPMWPLLRKDGSCLRCYPTRSRSFCDSIEEGLGLVSLGYMMESKAIFLVVLRLVNST